MMDVVGILALACAHCILTCKQKDSLLVVNSSDWPHRSLLAHTLLHLVAGVLWVCSWFERFLFLNVTRRNIQVFRFFR